MSDFKPDIKLPTAIEIDKLIRRFGDPHETQHSMGERFAIADALKATTERIAKLEAALNAVYHHAPINPEYGYQGVDADAMFFIAKKALLNGEVVT